MKISELIEKLEEAKTAHEDLDVRVYGDGTVSQIDVQNEDYDHGMWEGTDPPNHVTLKGFG